MHILNDSTNMDNDDNNDNEHADNDTNTNNNNTNNNDNNNNNNNTNNSNTRWPVERGLPESRRRRGAARRVHVLYSNTV